MCRWRERGGEGVNQQSTQIGSAANLERICTVLILGDQLTANSDRICNELREDLHRVLVLGGGVCSEPSKGEGCSTVNSERICTVLSLHPTQIGSAANSEKICTVLILEGCQ